jgi:hypothetical protein
MLNGNISQFISSLSEFSIAIGAMGCTGLKPFLKH